MSSLTVRDNAPYQPYKFPTFHDWSMDEKGTSLVSPFYPKEFGSARMAQYQKVYPDLFLSLGINEETQEVRIELSQYHFTLNCYRQYPNLAARITVLWRERLAKPLKDVHIIPPNEIPVYNSRPSVNSISDVNEKFKNRFKDAQEMLEEPVNQRWEESLKTTRPAKVKATSIELSDCYTLNPELSNRNLGVAAASLKGQQPFQEDHIAMDKLEICGRVIPYFAVFEAQQGELTSDYLKINLASELQKIFSECLRYRYPIQRDLKLYSLLKTVFLEMGRTLKANQHNDQSASTALLAFILDDQLWVVNAGNSRALFCKNGEAIALSIDGVLKSVNEQRSIEKRGQLMIATDGEFRVKSHYISRGINHDEITSGINPRSQIIRLNLSKYGDENTYLVIGTSGLFKTSSSRQVATRVNDLSRRGKSSKEIALDLVETASNAGVLDSISALVVNLAPTGIYF